jgi:hypothetical protein
VVCKAAQTLSTAPLFRVLVRKEGQVHRLAVRFRRQFGAPQCVAHTGLEGPEAQRRNRSGGTHKGLPAGAAELIRVQTLLPPRIWVQAGKKKPRSRKTRRAEGAGAASTAVDHVTNGPYASNHHEISVAQSNRRPEGRNGH